MAHEQWSGIPSHVAWDPTWPEVPNPGLAYAAARDHAIERLFDYLAEVEWRYGALDGRDLNAFTIKRTSMFPEQPRKEATINLPAIGVIPSKHIQDEPWLGPPPTIEESYHVYGKDTVLVTCGEYMESLVLDVWTEYPAQRRSIIAGMESSVFHTERGPLYLTLPNYFDRVAVFTFEGTTRQEGDAPKMQRQFFAHLELRVEAVYLARMRPFAPHAMVETE